MNDLIEWAEENLRVDVVFRKISVFSAIPSLSHKNHCVSLLNYENRPVGVGFGSNPKEAMEEAIKNAKEGEG